MYIIEHIHSVLIPSRRLDVGNVYGALEEESIIFIDCPFFDLW